MVNFIADIDFSTNIPHLCIQIGIAAYTLTGRQRSCKPCTSYDRMSVCLSVCLSVCHTLALSENDAS